MNIEKDKREFEIINSKPNSSPNNYEIELLRKLSVQLQSSGKSFQRCFEIVRSHLSKSKVLFEKEIFWGPTPEQKRVVEDLYGRVNQDFLTKFDLPTGSLDMPDKKRTCIDSVNSLSPGERTELDRISAKVLADVLS